MLLLSGHAVFDSWMLINLFAFCPGQECVTGHFHLIIMVTPEL